MKRAAHLYTILQMDLTMRMASSLPTLSRPERKACLLCRILSSQAVRQFGHMQAFQTGCNGILSQLGTSGVM